MPYRDALRAARAGSASLATKVEKVWSVLQSATDLPEVRYRSSTTSTYLFCTGPPEQV